MNFVFIVRGVFFPKEKFYESYRNCLKIISLVTRQFKSLINNPNSSTRWLLIRTQAIGDAGDNNTALKMDIQTLRNRIKEIYHQKFLWNNTKIGIDGKNEKQKQNFVRKSI